MERSAIVFVFCLLASAAIAQKTFTDIPFMAESASGSPPRLAMVGWYQAQDYAAQTNYAPLTNILDKSGHGNHATNSIANSIKLTNAVINGRSAFYFPPSENKANVINSALFGGSPAGELFVVMRAGQSPGTAGQTAPWTFGNVGYVGASAHPFTDGKIYEHFGARLSKTGMVIPSNGTTTNWHIYNVSTRTNEMIVRVDGSIIDGMDIVTSGFTNECVIGKAESEYYYGFIAEMLLYSNVVSSSQRELIHKQFTARYGIPHTATTLTFTPSSYGSMRAWWKADSITGIADGSACTNWTDSSGNGFNWTNQNATTAPVYHASTFNGKPSVGFTDSANAGTGLKMLLTASSLALTNFTTIVIGRYTNADCTFLSHATDGNYQWRTRRGGVNVDLLYNGGESLSATFPRNIDELRMDVWERNGTNFAVQFWQNMTNSAGIGGTASGAFQLNKLGSAVTDAAPTGGDISEIVIYEQLLAVDALAKLYYTYFKPKYGLP